MSDTPTIVDMKGAIVHHRWKSCGWIGEDGEFHWLGPVPAGPVSFRVIHADGRFFWYTKAKIDMLLAEATCMSMVADAKWGLKHGELQVECMEGES